MHPNKQVVENCMRDYRTKNIAMSIFASGKLGGKAAIDHALKGLNDGLIDSVLFGSSSENNIRNTFQSIIENSG